MAIATMMEMMAIAVRISSSEKPLSARFEYCLIRDSRETSRVQGGPGQSRKQHVRTQPFFYVKSFRFNVLGKDQEGCNRGPVVTKSYKARRKLPAFRFAGVPEKVRSTGDSYPRTISTIRRCS